MAIALEFLAAKGAVVLSFPVAVVFYLREGGMCMKIDIKEEKGVKIVEIDGRIDGQTAQEAENNLVAVVEADKIVVLDMSKVPFVTSAGLRALLSFYRSATAAKCNISLVGLSEEIQDVMTITGFLGFFKVYDTMEAFWAANKVST